MNWRALRDRWLGDPAVRARIGRGPFGRGIAGRHARRLFGVVAGFAESQMLAAALELGVFATLRAGPRPWRGVADLPEAGSAALRQALIAIGLIEPRGGDMALTVDGLVVATDPGLQAMIRHNRLLYADLADPLATLRGAGPGRLAAFWPYAGAGDGKSYSALMSASNAMVAEAVLASVDFGRAGHIMDVGGGHGAFLSALRGRYPAPALTLVDLPEVLASRDLASERIAVRGIPAEAPLPVGADMVTLLRVLHDHDDAGAAALLSRVAAVLPVGGHLIIAEPMAASGHDPQTAYFAAYFAAMRSGRLRTPTEIAALLRAAGLRATRTTRGSPLVTIIDARHV